MQTSVSLLSHAAAALYLLVLLACMAATFTAYSKHQQKWHGKVWLGLLMLFALLIASRYLGIEEFVRESLRDILRDSGTYFERRELQGPVVAGVLVIGASVAFYAFYRLSSRVQGRRNIAALVGLASGAAMLALICLRVISLHSIDRALYGFLKLNWVGDLGTSVTVMAAAIYYVRIVRARP